MVPTSIGITSECPRLSSAPPQHALSTVSTPLQNPAALERQREGQAPSWPRHQVQATTKRPCSLLSRKGPLQQQRPCRHQGAPEGDARQQYINPCEGGACWSLVGTTTPQRTSITWTNSHMFPACAATCIRHVTATSLLVRPPACICHVACADC
jgi:hypothetical protein